MRLPFSLANPIGSQLSRKLLDLERTCISILNSSHIMSYWQILESPHKFTFKNLTFVLCCCCCCCCCRRCSPPLSQHLQNNQVEPRKTTTQPTNQPTPRVAPGRQVVSLCANLVANPRSFDQWISLMKLAPRSRNAGGKIWEDWGGKTPMGSSHFLTSRLKG